MQKLSAIVLVAITFSTVSAEYLSVPSSLRSKAIYYKRAKQLNSFSCGYNVLFNAVNFEHHCGFENGNHVYDVFKGKVVPYVESVGYNPKKTSYNAITEFLASNTLKLQPLYHLRKDKKRLGGIGFSRTRNTSKTFLQVGIRDRWREEDYERGIKHYLATHDQAVVHFLCYVNGRSGSHGILVSLYKNETGRGLYVFDNLNDPIYESDDTTKFLIYLCNAFSVSKKDSFVGVSLPKRWPYVG